MNKQNIFLSVIFLFIFIGCEKTDYTINSEYGPKLSDIIVFEQISNVEPVADSASYTDLVVALNKLTDTAFLSIQMSTDKGFFANGKKKITVTANSDREAKVTLYSSLEDGIAHIQAKVSSITIDTSVLFVKALPETIQLNPSIIVTNKQTVNLGLGLGRLNGRVNAGIMVFLKYKSIDSTGGVLDIQPFMITTGNFDSVYISNPLNIKSKFEVSAQVLNQELDTISSRAIIIFE